MKFEQIKYFLILARHQHLTKAAAEACISPSAITHSIQNLEQELGCALFVKQGRRLKLNENGQRLIPYAQSLINQTQTIKQAMRGSIETLDGHFRLGATHLYCEHVLTPSWMQLSNEHPQLSAQICSYPSHVVVEKVLSGELDFGLCLSPHSHPDIELISIKEDELTIALNSCHPFINTHQQDISQLQHYPMAVSKGSIYIANCETHPMLKHYNIKSQAKLYYDSYSCALKAIENSNLWALLPKDILQWSSSKLTSIDVPLDCMNIELVAIWSKHNPAPNVINALIAQIQA